MKKILKKFLITLICFICTITTISTTCNARDDIIGTGENWINLGKQEQQSKNLAIDRSEFNDLAGILWNLGLFVVLTLGVTLGIKYMFSSVEEKATIKESMTPYAIGAVIILGALTIWKIAVEFMEELI